MPANCQLSQFGLCLGFDPPDIFQNLQMTRAVKIHNPLRLSPFLSKRLPDYQP
jgi:hypothetical protein